MQARNRTLLALAIAAALLPGLALADKPSTTGQGHMPAPAVSRIPVTSGDYRSATSTKARTDVPAAKASDSTRVDADTDTDTNDNDEVVDTGDDADADANAGGTHTTASTHSAAQTNPGQGNWWADADADADGRLSRDEAKANAGLDARFATADANGDGYVTQEEYRAFYTANASQGEQHADDGSAVVTRDVWSRFDKDSDARLSAIEVDLDAKLKADFGAIDADGDGYVTDAEYQAYYRGK